MSESEGRKPTIDFPQFDALEAAVRRALRQLEVWRERASAQEAERRRLQEVIDKMGSISADLDASEATAEIERLRAENEVLRQKLAEGRRRAEKLAQEVEFLEDAR
jgi:predicted RNase H-like nuclease (RuvC/YqgF family)